MLALTRRPAFILAASGFGLAFAVFVALFPFTPPGRRGAPRGPPPRARQPDYAEHPAAGRLRRHRKRGEARPRLHSAPVVAAGRGGGEAGARPDPPPPPPPPGG